VSVALLWALVLLGFGIVVVRRRSAAIVLLAAQSLLLASVAFGEATGSRAGLAVAAAALLARAIVLPFLLARAVRRTREPRRVVEGSAIGRLVVAVAAVAVAVPLVPAYGLEEQGAHVASMSLVVLGIAIAAVRRPVVLQAIGFLVAENGVYLAGLAVAGGLPGAIELGVLFDLLVVLAVAVAFGSKIHEELGTSDTALLRGLRD
jgi:hydrogenase-4 component E